jgi:hypothetical protein
MSNQRAECGYNSGKDSGNPSCLKSYWNPKSTVFACFGEPIGLLAGMMLSHEKEPHGRPLFALRPLKSIPLNQ